MKTKGKQQGKNGNKGKQREENRDERETTGRQREAKGNKREAKGNKGKQKTQGFLPVQLAPKGWKAEVGARMWARRWRAKWELGMAGWPFWTMCPLPRSHER
jgi:hypothetical protein